MPAYNEEANIEATVRQWHPVVEKVGADARLVIVNDGSKDATFAILTKIKAQYPQLIPIDKPNGGHGATCLFAYQYAIDNGADFVFQTDSDGQTNPAEFWEFWSFRNENDFIIGNRTSREDGFSRVVVTRTLRLVVGIIFGVWVADLNTPFRLMKTERLKSLIPLVPKDFFLSNVIISLLVVKKKERAKWLPISFKNRQGGVNSINIRKIIKIGFRSIKDFRAINRDLKNK